LTGDLGASAKLRALHLNDKGDSMADDKRKIREDKNLISFKQNYEVNYAVNQLKKQFPGESKTDIKEALFEAAKEVRPSEGREKIMKKARKTLRD
jgi:hypothetical protein